MAGEYKNAQLAAGAALGQLIGSAYGATHSVLKTEAATHVLLPLHATKDRAVIVIVYVDETYAIAAGVLPTVAVGETGTTGKGMANTVLDTEAAGTVLKYGFLNTAGTAIIITSTAAGGAATGGCTVTVLAVPTS